MKIIHIEMKQLEIPFRVAFKHAAAERSKTETVITIARSERGFIGYGEGCPRGYVTDESIDSAMSFFTTIKSDIQRMKDLVALREWVATHQREINTNPAAWCSIETALLDLMGKEAGKPIDALLDLPKLQGIFNYTAVLGVADRKAFQAQLTQYVAMGFGDFKLKLCGVYDIDKGNIDELRGLPNIKVRADANNLWRNADEVVRYIQSLNYNFWAVEEPLTAGDYAGLADVAQRLKIKIILDESFLMFEQLETIGTYSIPWVLNIRLSKMGGIFRSLRIADEAKVRGLQFVIGAQVGESSILTRLALSLANAHRANLLAQEGAFGTYLLQRDVTKNPIMFGVNGEVKSASVVGDGLGIECGFVPLRKGY